MSETGNVEPQPPVEDKSENEQQTGDTGQQTKQNIPPSRGKTFGGTGAEKRG